VSATLGFLLPAADGSPYQTPPGDNLVSATLGFLQPPTPAPQPAPDTPPEGVVVSGRLPEGAVVSATLGFLQDHPPASLHQVMRQESAASGYEAGGLGLEARTPPGQPARAPGPPSGYEPPGIIRRQVMSRQGPAGIVSPPGFLQPDQAFVGSMGPPGVVPGALGFSHPPGFLLLYYTQA